MPRLRQSSAQMHAVWVGLWAEVAVESSQLEIDASCERWFDRRS